MRTFFRKAGWTTLAVVGAFALLSACSQPTATSTDTSQAGPSDSEREAQMAAQQLAALGGAADAATQALYQGEFEASGSLEEASSGDTDTAQGADTPSTAAQGGGETGSEGAWELKLLNDYAQFVRPGLGQDGGIPGQRNIHAKGMQVVAGPLTITLMARECSLPNGVKLPYSANVLFEGVSYQGCARRGVATTGIASTWASVLPELMPAINACLARVSSRPGRVTTASTQDEGQVSVRIRESDGSRRDCVVDSHGQQVTHYDPVSDVDRRTGEGDPEFQLGATAPHAGRCQIVAEAKDNAGAHLGWLIERGPCSSSPPPDTPAPAPN
jgi:hypothetical protein